MLDDPDFDRRPHASTGSFFPALGGAMFLKPVSDVKFRLSRLSVREASYERCCAREAILAKLARRRSGDAAIERA